MPSPDLRAYTDLILFDRDPFEITNTALTNAATALPGYQPQVGDLGATLIETLATIVAEDSYALNRVPGAIMEILLQLFAIFRDRGAVPTASVTITLATTTGLTVPAGTVFSLNVGATVSPVVFTLDADLVFAPTVTTHTGTVTGTSNTDAANGYPIGTVLQVSSSQPLVQTVTFASTPSGGRLPESDASWIARGTQALARLNQSLVRASDFSFYALEQPSIYRAKGVDNYQPTINGLTPNQANLVLGTTSGWQAVAPTVMSVSGTAAESPPGYGLVLAAPSVGTGPWTLAAIALNSSNPLPFQVVPGFTYTGLASFEALSTVRSCNVVIRWLDRTGALFATSTGANVTDSASGWTQAFVTDMAPANAHFATVCPQVLAVAVNSETHNVAQCSIAEGSSTAWQAPVTPNSPIPGFTTVAVMEQSGVFAPLATRQSLQTAMQALAQANLQVEVINPQVNYINVTTTVVAKAGWVHSTVQANVTAALQGYLSTDAWTWDPTVYVNGLIAVIGAADGVATVSSVTTPAADVPLVGAAPLAQYGTLTVTVN